MAVQFIDGFEAYGTTNGNAPVGLQAKYLNASADSGFTVQNGRIGGKAIRPAVSSFFGPAGFGDQGTVVVGFGYYVDTFSAAAQPLVKFWDNTYTFGRTTQITVVLHTDGKFKVYRGSENGTLLGTSSSGLTASTWAYVEIKVKFHGSTGTVDIHLDGSSVLSLSSQNTSQTGDAYAQSVVFFGSNNGADHSTFDDLYVLDTTGSINTDFLGPQRIVLLQPNSDTTPNQFTTNTGSTHYDRVSQNPSDGDSTYLEDSTSGHQELFNFDDIANVSAVTALQINTVARLTDANQFSLKNSIKSGATDSDDTGQPVSNDYQTRYRCVEADPNTSSAWTVANVNTATFGFKVG
jgi:hypothetical protein